MCTRFRKESALLFHNLTRIAVLLDLWFTYPNLQAVDAFGGEVLCTFLLVMTVFAATDGQLGHKKVFIGSLLPWAIGMAVFLGEVMLFITPAVVHGGFESRTWKLTRTLPLWDMLGASPNIPTGDSFFRNQSNPR